MSSETKGKKKGVVIRKSSDKTLVVKVKTLIKHPNYDKYIKRDKNYQVHDEKNESNVGDNVLIIECRPMSRTKRWRVASK